ncbi:hypothetical protein PspLS_07791 [Pyricularia sp. CBS 133598]|nr:hypothetical protein PspLS_07791 [Pyricularia sp. CBS 133598]
MGNTQSTESSHGPDYERKAPAKLVKQRYDANADDMRFFSSSSTPGLILAGGHPARRYTMPAGQSPSVASFDHSVPLPTRQNSSTALNLLSAGREPLFDAASGPDSTADEKQRKDRNRRSIFRSKSSSAETTRRAKPERRNTIIATSTPPLPPIEGQGVALPTTRMSMFIGPSDSAYLDEAAPGNWHINDNRTSWHYDLKTYDAKRLLNLVQDKADASRQEEGSVGVSAGASEQRFSVVSETTWKSSHPAQTADNSPLPRVNSDLSMYTPVRRRSVIQTPGVATRHNSSRPPSVNHRFSHPPTPSNLSRQPSLEFEGRVKSMPPPPMPMPEIPPMPRIRDPDEPLGLVTPCEGDYQTIGAFKLGTLRITNGCASPVPSPEPDEKHMINPPAPSSPQLQNSSSYFTQKLAAVDAYADPEADVVGDMDGIVPGSRSRQIAKMTLRSSIDFIESTAQLPEVVAENQLFDSNARIVEPSLPSPWLQTTSRTNAVEDNLFDDDAQPEYSMVEKLDLRLDPNAKRDLKSENLTQARGISRSDSGFVSSPNSEYPTPQKALSKTDSGYSSNISLRSLRDGPSKKANAEGDRSWTVALRRMSSAGSALEAPVPELKLVGSLEVFNSEIVAEPLRSPPPPTPPPKDFPVAALGRRSSLKPGQVVTGQPAGNAPSKPDARDVKQDTPSPSSSRTWQVVPVPAESPSSPHSATSEHSGSALSIGSSPVKPGRLQRFLSIGSSGRSKSLTAHATHVAEETDIPPVPKQMRRNLRTHSGLFPMTTKRLAIRPQRSRDTLKTIISVGSLEVNSGAKDPLPYIPSANSASSSTVDHRQTFAPSSLGQVTFAESEAAVEADLIAPKPTRTPSIPRKPVPSRGESVKRILSAQFYKKEPEAPADVPPAADPEPLAYAANNSKMGNNTYETEARAITEEGRMQGLFSSPTGRAKSLTSQVERSWSIKNWASPSPTLSSFGPQDPAMPQSPASIPSPLIPEIMRKKKTSTPPPVSMRTRNQPTARASQPLRAMSTPSAHAQSDMLASSSRRSISHEVLRQSPLSYGRERPQQQFLGGLEPSNSPSNASPTSHPQYMAPDWPIRSDHSSFNKRHTAIGQVNNADLFIAELPADEITQRPSTSGAGEYHRPKSSHRAGPDPRFSQDFVSQSSVRPPPAHANQPRGILKQQSSPNFDPKWNRGPSQQFQQHWEQQEQQLGGRYHPYVPRGHGRNRSLTLAGPASGQSGQGVPYRILHSYNSPAYKNAPIWG